MFKISSVTFLGASVWRVSALRVSEPTLEPVSVEPHNFILNLPDVSGDFESGIAHVIHGLVFNSEDDLPGIFVRTDSWCYYRSWVSDDSVTVTYERGSEVDIAKSVGIFLSELYDWLCTANSPLLSLAQSVHPRSLDEYNASVREARQFPTVVAMLTNGKLPSSDTVSFKE